MHVLYLTPITRPPHPTTHSQFWQLLLEENEESKFQKYLYGFENHERSVNAVRFSPDGRSVND